MSVGEKGLGLVEHLLDTAKALLLINGDVEF